MHGAKLLKLFSPHPKVQQVYSCCHNYLTVTQSYNKKNTPICRLHAVRRGKSVLIYVFKLAFPTSLLGNSLNFNTIHVINHITPVHKAKSVQYHISSIVTFPWRVDPVSLSRLCPVHNIQRIAVSEGRGKYSGVARN